MFWIPAFAGMTVLMVLLRIATQPLDPNPVLHFNSYKILGFHHASQYKKKAVEPFSTAF